MVTPDATARCGETRHIGGLKALIAVSLNDHPGVVRCRLDAGHDGPHTARYSPFPGFADEAVTWSGPDESSDR